MSMCVFVHVLWRHTEEVEVKLHIFITSALGRGEWSVSHCSCLAHRGRALVLTGQERL